MTKYSVETLIEDLTEVTEGDNTLGVAILGYDRKVYSIYAIKVIGDPPTVVLQTSSKTVDEEQEALEAYLERRSQEE